MTPDQRTRRDAVARQLQGEIGDDGWSLDELLVIDEVMNGLARGRDVYGPLDLDSDRRDFRAETRAELRDALVYMAAHTIVESRRAKERELDNDLSIPLAAPRPSASSSRRDTGTRTTPVEGTVPAVATARSATQPSNGAPARGHQDVNFFDTSDVVRISDKTSETRAAGVLLDFEMLDEGGEG